MARNSPSAAHLNAEIAALAFGAKNQAISSRGTADPHPTMAADLATAAILADQNRDVYLVK